MEIVLLGVYLTAALKWKYVGIKFRQWNLESIL